ncbi:hypothetical protein ACFYP4_02875 [Streptomyces sp. NPDC005551]|uniref:hypothetical protein n=1 Tax=Streptomyces sp. NPDC005551 TaxID=3364725 RepID=UPI0036C268A2
MAYPTASYNPPLQQGQTGSEVRAGGGGGFPIVGARNALDMRRMMQSGRTPDAEYPDGYLGASTGRHQDKLLQSYGAGGTRYDRPYDRGVHKGDRMDRGDYDWPSWLTPMSGIERQSRTTERFAPVGRASDVPTIPGSNASPSNNNSPANPADLARFAPSWR